MAPRKEREKMRRLFFLSVILLAGCQNVLGPFRREPQRPDNPALSIGEQERLGRGQLALPEDYSKLTPPAYVDRPGPNGR